VKKQVNIRDLTFEEIETFIAHLGKEKFRARQIMKWVYQFDVNSFAEMTTLSRDLRLHLSEVACLTSPEIVKIEASKDGTKKVLLRLQDGLHIESVLIPGKNHWTACLSTQAGCAMGCRFCFTGTMGLKRNLLPSEIAGQLTTLKYQTPEGHNVKNIVLMGMGEPLANYDNTLKAVRIMTSDAGLGLSHRKVTISTCGLAPKIVQLGKDICVNLAISRRRLTFEYILMAGVNDSPQDAEKVAILLKNLHCKLNLILFNEFPGSEFKTPTPEAVASFQQVLLNHNYTTIIRASRGSDILAACGQLSGQSC